MHKTNWRDISYLEQGTKKQKSAFKTLKKHQLLERLFSYDAVLVSTVCVNLDIETSDLDIICQHQDTDKYKKTINEKFGNYPGFKQWDRDSASKEIVTTFQADCFELEIFSSIIPVTEQFAYRHLSMMERTLKIGGKQLRKKVRTLKKTGLKTEPSFAKVLGLTGDPCIAFLELEYLSDAQLSELIKKNV